MTFPLDADTLVPHAPPMRWIRRLIACENDCAVSEAQCDAGDLPVDAQGRLEPPAFIELVAQTFAAMRGYQSQISHQPAPKGYLVGVPRAELLGTARVGEILRTELKAGKGFESFFPADGVVYRGTDPLADVSIVVWEVVEDGEGGR